MTTERFSSPIWFRLLYTALLLGVGFGGLDALLETDYSLLRRFFAFVFLLAVAWSILTVWTFSVEVREDDLEVRRLWPVRVRHRWERVAECRHGTLLSFVVLRDGRWVALGWVAKPGRLQVLIEQAIQPYG